MLLNKKIYLAGAIDDVPDCGITWRRKIAQTLFILGVKVLDPTNDSFKSLPEDHEDIKLRRALLEQGEYDKVAQMMMTIRMHDLGAVADADILIAKLDMNYKHCGTYEEIFTAIYDETPVLIWCEQGKNKVPHWLWGCCDHNLFFSTEKELVDHLLGM